jgi:hypothetical protein
MTRVAIDLDGVMIDSRRALVAAYRAAGVEHVPNVPWRAFCSAEQHAEKNRVYPEMLRLYARVLPLGHVADLLDWQVLTGASEASVAAIRSALGLRLDRVLTGLSAAEKIRWASTYYDLYLDDDPLVIEGLRGSPCRAVLVPPP